MSTALHLPHWDMTVVYPSLDSLEFERDFQSIIQDIRSLSALFDGYHVEKREGVSVDGAAVEAFDLVAARLNDLLARLQTIQTYVYCFVATDSRDSLAQARQSELQEQTVLLTQLDTRFTAWLGSMDVEALVERSAVARDHAYLLQKAKAESEHLMSPPEEDLAAELGVSGGASWGKLHSNMTSQLAVPLEVAGEQQVLPMSVVRNLAYDEDRDVRRRAYDAELVTWQGVAVPLAAALNSIKGQVNTLAGRRGWESALDVALFHNNIDRQTLDAMFEAARDSFPDFRRYLWTKARALGLPALAWYDLFAPVGEPDPPKGRTTRTWEFDEARTFLLEQFGSYSGRLRGFAERAYQERWIDAEPRPGKRDGAFCVALRGEESRVLANYRPTYDGMSTLAHELGHGYHNFNLAGRTPLQRDTPMTLAETASIFCETIVREAALQRVDQQEQIAILEASLQGSCQVVVDIVSRFLFEQRVFEGRRRRELSVEELNELMLQAQRETYGDGLDQTALHPYMWAVKGHYYSPARSFYNFPYMFGLLFGLGLYARYVADPTAFRAGYDELLSSTGLADAATLASGFGIDIRRPDFWRSSLDLIRADNDRLEALVR
ncbi:MAG: M3 family oligoendopeptidase [Chloroflexi bacterium]|nr:M3 family oligoendopeptidase [Chloroflexota bacterium]